MSDGVGIAAPTASKSFNTIATGSDGVVIAAATKIKLLNTITRNNPRLELALIPQGGSAFMRVFAV